jgi:tetratricopeptide (TPR) repeat protein
MSGTRTRLSPSIFASRRLAALVLAVVWGCTAAAKVGLVAQGPQQDPNALLDGAVADFERGQIDQSVAKFDQLVAVAPRAMPQLWQRGIALYYAGRYDDCRKQFEAHRTVNPDDVENAAWHYLCVARAESPARARAALLPVGPDARVPMKQVYELFKGAMTAEQVMSAGGTSLSGQFYANLYLGLYYEATGDAARARTALETAAGDRFRAAGGYMHMVARVHVARLATRR